MVIHYSGFFIVAVDVKSMDVLPSMCEDGIEFVILSLLLVSDKSTNKNYSNDVASDKNTKNSNDVIFCNSIPNKAVYVFIDHNYGDFPVHIFA